ncbi:AAA-domain-containing protein [Auriscalpium vulgare]|uniref:AAA-domain-containing protein n=1 Tax=Auriscalpium vulgare TaxID=40419 RepID=A0ACB8S4C0_9AGAM|nr:AAA-domain-containing protein [Auriscalpium vulgare]
MRSPNLLSRARILSRSSVSSRALLSYSGPARYPRKDGAPAVPPKSTRVYRRASSSTPAPDESASPSEPGDGDGDPQPEVVVVRIRNGKVVEAEEDKPESPGLPTPPGEVLWSEEFLSERLPTESLPPPEILEEALNNLYVSLHPKTQHKAAYSSPSGPPVEPTLALYCPIEGGDYILDNTVRELARRTGADVVVLDAVQLAAGEWGHFGKAATLLDLPENPLHFPSHASPSRQSRSVDEDDDMDFAPMGFPSQMTLHVVTPSRSSKGSSSSSSNQSIVKSKMLFDQLVNMQAPATSDPPTPPNLKRPRLIYIRDFPTMAASSSSWYPALLAAVRARRQGPLARSTSPVTSPVTIVFGITPPITPPTHAPSSGSGPRNMMSLLTNRSGPPSASTSPARPGKSEWTEDELAERARERRLRDRLRKWERGDATLLHELPKPSVGEDNGEDSGSNALGASGVVVIGPNGAPRSFPSLLGGPLAGVRGAQRSGPSDSEVNSQFFRTSFLVPASRSSTREKASRIGRRREINQLTMRMAVGAIGGVLPADAPNQSAPAPASQEPEGALSDAKVSAPATEMDKMWDEWGKKVEPWSAVTQIADQVVGNAVHASGLYRAAGARPSLSPAAVAWSDVRRAWAAQQSSRDVRKAWMQEAANKPAKEHQQEDEDDEDEGEVEGQDEVIENVKRDPYLDQHEQRLLSCIVDAGSMPTSFSQVHLPPHTIDSIRTIVSLPLLHPSSFQHGILKEHGMTGCLLFGPPGTGKTLAVRALAKEAGCRMLAISPSDVMDMYVGEGEKLVRSVFSLARRLGPCVVFIDEIDALFGARSSARETGGAIAHRGVLTEFMQEMDGLKSSKDDNVIVIGATNRPFDLDDAVLRRLPRRLLVDLPGEKEREGNCKILKILLRDETLAPDVNLTTLAQNTPSFSGSDLKHLCVSAALDAVKEIVTVPWALSQQAKSSPSEENPSATSSSSTASQASESPVTPEETTLSHDEGSKEGDSNPPADDATPATPLRTLRPHNFAKAMKEITPSASESLGTLADLRKWNEEFGEGRKQRKKQVWGKDRFGFTKQWGKSEDGRIASITTPADASA